MSCARTVLPRTVRQVSAQTGALNVCGQSNLAPLVRLCCICWSPLRAAGSARARTHVPGLPCWSGVPGSGLSGLPGLPGLPGVPSTSNVRELDGLGAGSAGGRDRHAGSPARARVRAEWP
eukprot:5591474-Lingulodinium_polyedra.AAC.1